IVAQDAGSGTRGTLEPIAVVEGAVSERGQNAPAIDPLDPGQKVLLDLRLAILHSGHDRGLLLGGETLEVGMFAGPDADTGEPGANRFLLRTWRRELQREAQVLEEVGLRQIL